uniref:Uncharacterized protein n=1 Tax=Anguilla anguilla TaxID=7936 RepID=A0A0E9U7Q9_ANGAN
MVSLGWSPVQV